MTRAEAIKLIDDRMCFGRGKWSDHHMPEIDAYWQAGQMAIKALEETEERTGKWINANDGKWNTVEVLKCSACGEMDNRMYRTDNYCPNCGAKMEG